VLTQNSGDELAQAKRYIYHQHKTASQSKEHGQDVSNWPEAGGLNLAGSILYERPVPHTSECCCQIPQTTSNNEMEQRGIDAKPGRSAINVFFW
jgi:hypothetical protein